MSLVSSVSSLPVYYAERAYTISVDVSGYPHRTETGQLSLLAVKMPVVLSPCLHKFPTRQADNSSEGRPQFLEKHIEMLSSQEPTHILLRRSQVLRELRNWLDSRGFVEVQTPILEATAGGAIARPFETTASEFPAKKISLRVAPELWLKRLILGGLDRVFEIGPSFRNEGTVAGPTFAKG